MISYREIRVEEKQQLKKLINTVLENLDYKKFEIVVNSYKKHTKREIDENIEKLIYADIYGGIGWINYNFKRALCIENKYEQDR